MAHRALIVFVLVAAACRPAPALPPSSPSPGSTATPTPLVAASPTSAAAATASPAPRITDATLARFLEPHAAGWRPADTTVIVEEHITRANGDREVTYVAVPADGRPPVRLLSAKNAIAAAARPDGGALVLWVAVLDPPAVGSAGAIGPFTSRLALWDGRTGDARWLVAEERGAGWGAPIWSADGAFIYSGRYRSPGTDLGIWRMRPDGGDLRQIIAGGPPVSSPTLVTPENILVWGRHGHEGLAVLEVRDLGSGRRSSYGGPGTVFSWRPTAPRALVVNCGGGGCRGLVVWDDQTGSKRTLLGLDVQVAGADWDTTGTEIVFSARSDPFGTFDLYTMDERTLTRTKLAGTQAAYSPHWLRAGIVYNAGDGKINIVPPSGGPSKTLLASSGGQLVIRGFVKP